MGRFAMIVVRREAFALFVAGAVLSFGLVAVMLITAESASQRWISTVLGLMGLCSGYLAIRVPVIVGRMWVYPSVDAASVRRVARTDIASVSLAQGHFNANLRGGGFVRLCTDGSTASFVFVSDRRLAKVLDRLNRLVSQGEQ